MSKDKLEDWDETADNNTDMGGIDLQENVMRPPAVNNEMREHMAQVAKWLGADTLASASTTDLGSVPGRYIEITGTTAITSLGTIKAGTVKYVRFGGALTLIHSNSAIVLPGRANITTAQGDAGIFASEGDGLWKCLSYDRMNAGVAAPPRGHIFGLTLSNNSTDPTNDVDIAAGEAASTDTIPALMVLSSTLTKRLDATWSAGTGNGGLDTGSATNTTYHVFLIRNSGTGAIDALFSTSATSPTMPSGYDQKRRIGSILRISNAIGIFEQQGDLFIRGQATDYNTTTAVSNTLVTLSVPLGVKVRPCLAISLTQGASGTSFAAIGDGSRSQSVFPIAAAATGVSGVGAMVNGIYTNTSAQIRLSLTVAAGSVSLFSITNTGWIDERGRLD